MAEFTGLWIPAEVWMLEISIHEKVLLSQVIALDNENGCNAENKYFADFLGVSKVRVSEIINSLCKKGLLASQIKVNEGNKRILKRSQTFLYDPNKEKINTLANFSLIPSQTLDEDLAKKSLSLYNVESKYKANTKTKIKENKEQQISSEILITQFQNENSELSKKVEELSKALEGEKKKKERKISDKKKEDESSEQKRPHGEHQNVFLLDAEVETLIKNNGLELCNMAVDKLSNYKISSGKKYKSDYGAINQWVLESVQKTINERRIQGNIIKKTETNEQQNRKGETSNDYLKRVGTGLDEILNIRFGRTGNQSADASENVSPNYSEFSIVG